MRLLGKVVLSFFFIQTKVKFILFMFYIILSTLCILLRISGENDRTDINHERKYKLFTKSSEVTLITRLFGVFIVLME